MNSKLNIELTTGFVKIFEIIRTRHINRCFHLPQPIFGERRYWIGLVDGRNLLSFTEGNLIFDEIRDIIIEK